MRNILSYYYNLYPDNILTDSDKYIFDYENKYYSFELYKRPLEDINNLYELDTKLIENNIMMHEIIKNNNGDILTYVNLKPYILMEINVNKNAKIRLSEICFINNNSINIKKNNALLRTNWTNLWESKIDYFESQINEIGKKYPNLCNYANYYIGLAENAIMYIKDVFSTDSYAFISVCHKRINSQKTYYELYNPLSLVLDFRVRDACEYIKSCFFNDSDAYNALKEYFKMNYVSYKEALLLYGRLIYPSYFFDLYDDIVNLNLDENKIENIVIKSEEYEKFLVDTYIYLSKLYNRYIPRIDWLLKKSHN